MTMKLIAAGLLCSTLFAPAALAQAQTPPAGNAPAPTGSVDAGSAGNQFITQQTQGVLRASDLIDKDIVGPNNEDVGEIEDIVLDRNGRVAAFIIEVDGALGIGDREIAVPASAVQVDPVDTTASTGTIRGAGLPASTPQGEQVRNQLPISRVLSPDRIMLTMPVDQLKSIPEFEDDD
jgi:sporulation protein YlmC with PRC-barrel domain